MFVYVNGKLAASATGSSLAAFEAVGGSIIRPFTTKEAVAWFVKSYRGLFPDAEITTKAEWGHRDEEEE